MPRQPRPHWVLFTDLDGTLLDHTTYRWTRARPALSLLRCRGCPLIIVTSKTRAEVLPVLADLKLKEPFVVENGGAIYLPRGYFPFRVEGAERVGRDWERVPLGAKRTRLVRVLAKAARQACVRVRGFAEMDSREIAALTGLSVTEARRAMQREFDEPFVLSSAGQDPWQSLRKEIEQSGLQAMRGSRFFHILGANDKGAAVRRLIAWFRRALGRNMRSVGLGDSPNDIPMLRAVDLPIVVARPGGRYDRETLAAVPGARRAGGVGPIGWDRAVRKLLRGSG